MWKKVLDPKHSKKVAVFTTSGVVLAGIIKAHRELHGTGFFSNKTSHDNLSNDSKPTNEQKPPSIPHNNNH